MARVGLLGGTFNPPHIGHLVCASEACEQLGLDRVELLPAGRPPHKEVEAEPGVAHRLTMCRLAVTGDDRLAVNALDAQREGPSYTADTLRALHGSDALTFIVGGDMAFSLPDWREPEVVLELARLGVAEREELRREAIEHQLARYGRSEKVDFFAMPRIDVSSSDLRRRLAAGRGVRYLVPDAVAEYVEREGLYR